jgi:hypothetical protein
MPVVNGVISAPVDFEAEVARALGLGKPFDCGFLCGNTHGKINMWSRNKPVRRKKLSQLTDAELADVNFAITIAPALNDYGSSSVSFNTQGWVYNAPRGGENEPFRITDFDGYSHIAVPPMTLDKYEYTWDRGIISLDDFYLTAFFKISASLSFGDTSGMQLSMNELQAGTFTDLSKNYWGIAYIKDGFVYCCNADNSFDQSSNNKAPVVRPGDWALRSVLESLSDNSYIEVLPVINLVVSGSVNGGNGNGGMSNPMYGFPLGKTIRITKIYTPLFDLLSQGNAGLFNNGTGAYLGCMSRTSSNFGVFTRLSSGVYRWSVIVEVKNPRTTPAELDSFNFYFELSGKTISGNNLIRCAGFVESPNYVIGSSSEGNSALKITLAAGETKKVGVFAEVPYAAFNDAFTYVDPGNTGGSLVTQSTKIRVRYLLETKDASNESGNYMYYYKISN